MKISLFTLLWTLTTSFCFAQGTSLFDEKNFGSYNEYQKYRKDEAKAPETTQCENEKQRDQFAYDSYVLVEGNKVKEAAALCILAFVSLVAVLYFLTKHETHPGPHIVSATALIFIIFGTITLVVMAQTEQQLTAAIGILGGVAGYLFGSMKRTEPSSGKNSAG